MKSEVFAMADPLLMEVTKTLRGILDPDNTNVIEAEHIRNNTVYWFWNPHKYCAEWYNEKYVRGLIRVAASINGRVTQL